MRRTVRGDEVRVTFGDRFTGPPLPWPVRVIVRAALRVRAMLRGKR
ncbi:hypothetical protein [Deinococcus sp. LM3]|nr:hypothetical protein [Deinococcus sp. LM3]